ncbi:MAG: cytochrome c biogenesis heme-transporting ATPase CcmA [Lautropia sp.]
MSDRLEVRDLTLERGHRTLFAALAIDLAPGELLQLQGPNGSGKSSLLRALLGLTPVRSGTIDWAGARFAPASGRLRRDALYQGHASGQKGELTALENLALAAALDGSPTGATALQAALDAVGLGPAQALAARRLSQGQRQRLALARLALPNPRRLWLLDEPSAALDRDGAARLDALLAAHLARGGAAIVATHLPLLAGRPTRRLALDAVPVAA